MQSEDFDHRKQAIYRPVQTLTVTDNKCGTAKILNSMYHNCFLAPILMTYFWREWENIYSCRNIQETRKSMCSLLGLQYSVRYVSSGKSNQYE